MTRNMEAIVWALNARGLSLAAYKVLLKLARRVGKRGFDVWPAHRSLAEDSEISVSSVRRAIAELEAGGWIKITARVDKAGDRTSNLYTLQVRMKISHPQDDLEIGPDEEDLDASIPEGRSGQIEQTVCPERTDGLLTGEQGTTQEEPIQEEDSPSPDGEAPPAGELALFGGELESEPPVPLEEFVLAEWHKLKAEFPKGIADIDVLTEDRKKRILKRAADVVDGRKKKGEICTPEDVWREIFAAIRGSTFLTGRDPPTKNYSRPFKLTIEYILRPREFLATLEKYEDGVPSSDTHDASGRRRGPAEQATRRTIERLFAGA